MSKGNFKVRCLETSVGNPYTVGKVYEFKNGHMINDDGEIWPSDYIEDFAAWQRWSGAKWELVHEQPYIRIFAHKNRIIATITKDEKKFTQSVSLTKAGDFKAAVKMVVEKLLDKFEVREQTHLTAPAFKVGDKVRLKKGLIERQKYGDIKLLPDMINDDVMTIIRISELNGIYYTDKDYYYSEEMLELANETPAFDWEAFKAGKFAVHCDTEEKAKAFLKECDGQGIKWSNNQSASSRTYWEVYKDKTIYNYSSGLGYCEIGDIAHKMYRWEIIDYTPSKPAVKETKSYRIVKQDKYEVGDKVKIIDKWVDGCHENPEGEMDKWLGKIMTIRVVNSDYYRMEEDKTEHLGSGWYWNNKCIEGKVVEDVPEKTAVKEVKRPAKVGEWIKIVNADHMERYRGCEEYKNGDILKVAKTNACCLDDVLAEGISEWIDKREYVVLENYQQEQSSIDSNTKPEQLTSSTGMREVERLAQAGEIVKIVNAFSVPVTNGEDEYSNGDILKIIEGGYQVRYAEGSSDDGRNRVLNQSEYVVLENYDYSLGHPKNEPFRKAKVGDKIKVVMERDYGHFNNITKSESTVISEIDNEGVWSVNRNYYYDKDQEYIIIEEAPKVKPDTIEIGDTVKVIGTGRVCTTYGMFIEMYAKEFYSKYSNGYEPKTGDIGVVVGIGEHEIYREDYLVVLANGKVFCIHPEGVEKVQ